MSTEAQVPVGDPLLAAWEAHRATPEYANSRRWAAHEQHVEGSLWALFMAGWIAALADRERRGEPVAWMNPDSGDVITDDRKHEWMTCYGAGGVAKATAYTVPLYTAPQPADEVKRLRADAARYRWLRERHQAMTTMPVALALGLDLRRVHVNTVEKFDAAIDAAMRGSDA